MRSLDATKAAYGALPLANPKPDISVILAMPRGFCAGVRRAIEAVHDALAKHGAPVFVRRAIVHNLEVVRALEAEGAVFVEDLEEVPPGSVVLFSAHGVAPHVAEDAKRRDLISYDAVCPLVAKVHREVQRHEITGRQIVLIGHRGHPEIVGTLGHVSSVAAHVVQSVEEVERLPLKDGEPTAYAVQTTYSVDDAHAIVEALRRRFTNLVGPSSSDICYATTNRQTAVRLLARQSDAVIVAGEQFSSNACRLAEVASDHCEMVQLIANPVEIDWERLPAGGVIGITAAASTPETSVQSIIGALRGRYCVRVEEAAGISENTVFKRMAIA